MGILTSWNPLGHPITGLLYLHFSPHMFRALCAHPQEVKIVLYSIWYRHTCRWPSGAQVERGLVLSEPVHRTATIPDAV